MLLKAFYLTHAGNSKGKNWKVYSQLDLEMVSKTLKKIERIFNLCTTIAYQVGQADILVCPVCQ
jgi:hypothetical protein